MILQKPVPQWLREQWPIWLLACVCLFSYSNSFQHAFVLDDSYGITSNPTIRQLRQIPSFFLDSSTSSTYLPNSDYRPLVQTTYALNYQISGFNMWSWHLFHIFLHFVCVACLFLFVRAILNLTRGASQQNFTRTAFFCALLFAVHPYVSGVINYQWARSTLQASALLFPALLCYLKFRQSSDRRFYFASLILFTLALFSKVEAIAGLGILWLLETLIATSKKSPNERSFLFEFFESFWKSRTQWGTFVTVSFCYLVLRYAVIPDGVLQGTDRSNITPTHYFLTQLTTWWHYTLRWFVPLNLIADDQTYPVYRSFFAPSVLLALSGWVLCAVLLTSLWKKRPEYLFFVVSGLILLSPTSSVAPLAEMVNEHRPYLALALASLVWLVPTLEYLGSNHWRQSIVRLCPVVLLAMVFCSLTLSRNQVYQSRESYWKDVLIKAPSARAHNNFGLVLMERGQFEIAKKHFQKAKHLAPRWFIPLINLGVVYQNQNQIEKAETYFTQAVELDHNSVIALTWREQFYRKTGHAEKAAHDARTSRLFSRG